MKTLIIDANYIAHRALHSMGDLEFGEIKTGVVFGFLNQIYQLSKKFETNKFIFCWDSTDSLRKKIEPTYKYRKNKEKQLPIKEYKDLLKQRKELFKQFTALRSKILPMIGFNNNYIQQGYEGDDMIAKTVMSRTALSCIIVTADEDMLQLLDFAPMYKPQTKLVVTAKQFKQKWGISPATWADVKAIAGCTSDNVQGMTNIGEITAAKFITNKLNPCTKTYKRIYSEHQFYLDKNLPLVKLPLKGTKLMKLKRDTLNMSGFYKICTYYGLSSLLDNSLWWKSFCAGNII